MRATIGWRSFHGMNRLAIFTTSVILMATALVTGASGFIGPHLVGILQQAGYDITVLVRSQSDRDRLAPFAPRWATGDICDPAAMTEAVKNQDVIFHLAGLIKAFNLSQFLEVNELGTGVVLEACSKLTTPPTVVVVSSLAGAGPSPTGHLRSESEERAPVSNYGASKRAQELKAESFADRMPISIVRPPMVFGEGDPGMLAMFKPIARTGIHFVPGLTAKQFSLVHAVDLSQALRLVAESGARISKDSETGTGIYFAASDEHPSYADLGRQIGKALGRRRTFVLYSPFFCTRVAACGAELISRARGQQQIFNLDKAREAAAGNWTCDPAKIQQQLGWKTSATLDDRLKQTAQWYQQNKWV